MIRKEGRRSDQLRPVRLERGINIYAEGSALISVGDTEVVASATVESDRPRFLRNSSKGWVTAEYSMLPRSTRERIKRERRGAKGRTMEIERLIGRSLRSVVDLALLGERSIIIDCDVLQADGGTRTASITAGYLALRIAIDRLLETDQIARDPMLDTVAAISCGVVSSDELLDLDYDEDSKADLDMNVVMTGSGKIVEIQATAEGAPFEESSYNRLLHLARSGIEKLTAFQRDLLSR